VRHICIQIWVLWNSEFSLKSRGSPQNHRSLSLNLRFKVADLSHLSWNLLQVAWFPSVPKKPPIDVLHFPPFRFRVHTHFCSRWIPPQIRDDPSSPLHNLTKKQWLIPLNSTLFCCDLIWTWMTFWIYIVSINVVKKSNYFLILILSVILLMKLSL